MLIHVIEERAFIRVLRDHPDPDLNPDPDPDPVGFGIPNTLSTGSGSGRVQSLRDGIGTGLRFLRQEPVFQALKALFSDFKKNICRKMPNSVEKVVFRR